MQTKNAHHQDIYIYQVGAQGMHLGVNVEDVAAAVAELEAAAVRVHAEPELAYGVTFAYVEAPDGVMLELTQY